MTTTHIPLGAMLIGSFLFPVICDAQTLTASPNLPSDAAVKKLLVTRIDIDRRNLGIVVGIVSPSGRRIISHGHMSLTDSRSPGADTVFEIGSVTKLFTSALLADMVQQGEVSLADSVFKYLPIQANPSNGTRTITLADLATHTAGLPLWPSNVPSTREGALAMASYRQDQLFEYLSSLPISEQVGRKWSYSNAGVGILGLALARRADSTYDKLVQSRITTPLKMKSTAQVLSESMKARIAEGSDAELHAAPRWDVPVLAGAGSLHSSANDMLTFLEALGDPNSPVGRILPTMLATRREGPGIPQALGWLIIPAGSPGDILTHIGGTLGFSSAVSYDPKSRTGVVVLSNTSSGVGDLARHILRPALPINPPATAAPIKTEISMDPALFDSLTGDYEPATGTVFSVSREGNTLMFQLPGLPKLRLRPEDARTFFVAENTRVTVTFDLDNEGRSTRLTLKAPTGNTEAKRAAGK